MHAALDFGDDGCRTYQRLESFLKRYVNSRSHEIVRAEPCVVVGRQFKQAFKFTVLLGSSLLILQNPPKYQKDLELTINLERITSVEQVHDIPDFINGDLKGKAQHISLNYLEEAESRSSLSSGQKVTKPTPQESSRVLNSECNEMSPDSSVLSSSSAGKSLDYLPSQSSSYGKSHIVSFRDSLQEKSFLRTYSDSRLPVMDKSDSAGLSSRLSKSNSKLHSPTPSRRPLPRPPPGTEDIVASNCFPGSKGKERDKRRQTKPVLVMTGSPLRDFQKQEQSYVTSINSSMRSEPNHFNRTWPHDMGSEQLSHSSSKSLNTSMSEKILGFLKGSKSSQIKSLSSLGSDSSFANIDKNDNIIHSSLGSESSTDAALSKETTLHIYLLIEGSPFFHYLYSSWISALLVMPIPSHCSSSDMSLMDNKHQVDESRLLGHFNELKAEMFDAPNVETLFLLVQELSMSCNKYFLLKRLIWKSPGLVNFFVNSLENNMKLEDGISQRARADQIDYMIAVTDLLAKAIRGTEHLSTRNKALHENGALLIKTLCNLCLKIPKISRKGALLMNGLSEGAVLLLSQSSEMLKDMRQNDEIISLLREWRESSLRLLFELFRAVEQAIWCYCAEKGITLSRIVKAVEEKEESVFFLEALIQDILLSLSTRPFPSQKRKLIVHLYQQYYVLNVLLTLSDRLLDRVHQSFYEEIRYYVHSSLSNDWLSDHRISHILKSLMDNVNIMIINGTR